MPRSRDPELRVPGRADSRNGRLEVPNGDVRPPAAASSLSTEGCTPSAHGAAAAALPPRAAQRERLRTATRRALPHPPSRRPPPCRTPAPRAPCASLAIRCTSSSSSSRRAHRAVTRPSHPSNDAAVTCTTPPAATTSSSSVGSSWTSRIALRMRDHRHDPVLAQPRAHARQIGGPGRVRHLEQQQPGLPPSPNRVRGHRRRALEPVECDLCAAPHLDRDPCLLDSRPHELERPLHRARRGREVVPHVRRRTHHANTALGHRSGHLERRVEVGGAVVQPRQHVAVEVDHGRTVRILRTSASPKSQAGRCCSSTASCPLRIRTGVWAPVPHVVSSCRRLLTGHPSLNGEVIVAATRHRRASDAGKRAVRTRRRDR